MKPSNDRVVIAFSVPVQKKSSVERVLSGITKEFKGTFVLGDQENEVVARLSLPISILNRGAEDHKVADRVYNVIKAQDIVISSPTGISVKHPSALSEKYKHYSLKNTDAWSPDACPNVKPKILEIAKASGLTLG